ncbi:hypothetical protein ACHQM5_006542 [Ranunculus cassubicifolius]
MANNPNVIVIPFNLQGHLTPLVKLSLCLVERGVKITMLIPKYIHARLIDSLPDKEKGLNPFDIVTFSSEPQTDDNSVYEKVTAEFQKLVKKMNAQIAGVIADDFFGQTFEVARIMGIPLRASYNVGCAGFMAFATYIPKMIEMGVIDENGTPKSNDIIIWSPSMPGIEPQHLLWLCMGDYMSPKQAFDLVVQSSRFRDSADFVLCNTFHTLEYAAIAMVPNILTIGPLLKNSRLGNLWTEDSTCMSWIDQQAANSVIYVSFGSVACLSQHQFDELALALDLLEKPFLWVVRSDDDVYGEPTTIFPRGFLDRVGHFGKIVSWAPQQKVLSHGSVACFVSHCGWNSTIEGVSNGVPFICWPYYCDQFFNVPYITDVWKVGLGLNPDKDGIISRVEITKKLNQLLGDGEIKQNSLKLKEIAMKSMDQGGSTTKNLDFLVEQLKKTGTGAEH